MFKFKSFGKSALIAAASLAIVSPAVAASADTAVAARVGSEVAVSEAFGGNSQDWLLTLLAAAAIIGGVIALAGDSTDEPVSP